MKKKNIIIISTLIIAILSLVTIGVYENQQYTKSRNQVNGEIIPDDKTEKLPEGKLAIKINTTIDFQTPTSYGKPGIQNKPENIYSLYVTIYLEDGNEKIFQSTILSPGEVIDEIKIDKTLAKGSHSAIAYFNAVDKNGNMIGKTGAKIKINIENDG